ncbi:MAG: FMN-binding protein [Bacteroidetes bacterium]|nr:FMN-binding protein [Bacteroidota bacterium]
MSWSFLPASSFFRARSGKAFSVLVAFLLGSPALHAGTKVTLEYESLARKAVAQITGRISAWQIDSSAAIPFIRVQSEGIAYTAFIDEVKGKTNRITYLLILDPAGVIVAIDVLVYRESYGGEIDYPVFKAQFEGKSARDLPVLNKNIRNISGATISCRSLTAGVAQLLRFYHTLQDSR